MSAKEAAYNHTEQLIDEANLLIRQNEKSRQIRKITKLYKYKFGWSRSTAFLYILKSVPEIVKEITEHGLKNYNLTQLYAAMDKKQLSLVIKRLEQIEKRNESAAIAEEVESDR
jgi:hypothetical protein